MNGNGAVEAPGQRARPPVSPAPIVPIVWGAGDPLPCPPRSPPPSPLSSPSPTSPPSSTAVGAASAPRGARAMLALRDGGARLARTGAGARSVLPGAGATSALKHAGAMPAPMDKEGKALWSCPTPPGSSASRGGSARRTTAGMYIHWERGREGTFVHTPQANAGDMSALMTYALQSWKLPNLSEPRFLEAPPTPQSDVKTKHDSMSCASVCTPVPTQLR